jgi:hypothetical protein
MGFRSNILIRGRRTPPPRLRLRRDERQPKTDRGSRVGTRRNRTCRREAGEPPPWRTRRCHTDTSMRSCSTGCSRWRGAWSLIPCGDGSARTWRVSWRRSRAEWRVGSSAAASRAVPRAVERRISGRRRRRCSRRLRPPLAQERLHVSAEGTICLTLRHRWADGTTHLRFDLLGCWSGSPCDAPSECQP